MKIEKQKITKAFNKNKKTKKQKLKLKKKILKNGKC